MTGIRPVRVEMKRDAAGLATSAISSAALWSKAWPSQAWMRRFFVEAGDLAENGHILHEAVDQRQAVFKDLVGGLTRDLCGDRVRR